MDNIASSVRSVWSVWSCVSGSDARASTMMTAAGCTEQYRAYKADVERDVTTAFLDPQHHAGVVALARDVSRVFVERGVAYGGAWGDQLLLGVEQCGGMLPWDDDADDMFVTPSLSTFRGCLAELYRLGMHVVRMRKRPYRFPWVVWPFDTPQLVMPGVGDADLQAALDDTYVYFRVCRGAPKGEPGPDGQGAASVTSLGPEPTPLRYAVFSQSDLYQDVAGYDGVWLYLHNVSPVRGGEAAHDLLGQDECASLFEQYAGQTYVGTPASPARAGRWRVTGVELDGLGRLGLRVKGLQPVFCNMARLPLMECCGSLLTTGSVPPDTPRHTAPVCLLGQPQSCSGVELPRQHAALLASVVTTDDCVVWPPHHQAPALNGIREMCRLGYISADVYLGIPLRTEDDRERMRQHSAAVRRLL